MALITITETSQELLTILPNGNIIRTDTLPIANEDQENIIGEKKRWKLGYTSDVSILGSTVYVNPALFVPSGAIIGFTPPGAIYYSYAIPLMGGVNKTYECALNNAGPTPNILKNYKVFIKVVTDVTFVITVEFYMTYDANGFLDPIYQDNASRFFKDIKTNPDNFVASDPDSVYSSKDRTAKILFYIVKGDDSGSIVSTTNFKGKFYNSGTVVNGVFSFSRNGVAVDNLSTSDNTKIQFDIDTPNFIGAVVIWIIDVTGNDITKDFLENYDAEARQIVTGDPNGTKLIGPFMSPQLVSGNTYRASAFINASSLIAAHSYRLIAVAYDSPIFTPFHAGSAISESLIADDSPCFDGTGFELEGRMRDYNIEWSGNDLEACIEERMQSVLKMDFTSNKWKNYLLARLGITGTNDIRRYLVQINCTIYREFTDSSSNLIRHVYATGTVNKTSPLVYTPTADIAADFPNDGTAEFTFDWRNRYEAGITNIQSLINGINVVPFDNQYWGGKTFKVEWELELFYDDYFSPFTDFVRFTQNLSVLDYNVSPFMGLSLDELSSEPINDPAAENIEVCYGSNACFRTVSPNDPMVIIPTPYKLIATIEAAPGSVSTIEEAEAWIGNELPQETTPKIIDEEEDFGQTEAGFAKFCVDTTKLILNLPYKITAIAKPKFDGCIRATELLEDRITETNDTRIPEECAN